MNEKLTKRVLILLVVAVLVLGGISVHEYQEVNTLNINLVSLGQQVQALGLIENASGSVHTRVIASNIEFPNPNSTAFVFGRVYPVVSFVADDDGILAVFASAHHMIGNMTIQESTATLGPYRVELSTANVSEFLIPVLTGNVTVAFAGEEDLNPASYGGVGYPVSEGLPLILAAAYITPIPYVVFTVVLFSYS